MSIEAISWVLKQDMARSSEKFVLLCMANYSDDRGFAYPSVAALEQNTSQDRKTVLANLKRLVEASLLRDTGRRVGATRQVIVYQLIGLPESSRTHYVYKLTHPTTGEYYIGKRSFNGHPELDQYRGSGRWPQAMKAAGLFLTREILEITPSSPEALACELQWLRRCHADPLCRNESMPATMMGRDNPPFNSPESGTVDDDEQSRFSGETAPLFPDNSPKNGTRNRQVTVKEPEKHKGDPLPPWMPAKPWGDFIADRRERKKPMTSRALQLAIAKLAALRDAGHDPEAVLLQSIACGWSGLFPIKAERAGKADLTSLAERVRAAGAEAKASLEQKHGGSDA